MFKAKYFFDRYIRLFVSIIIVLFIAVLSYLLAIFFSDAVSVSKVFYTISMLLPVLLALMIQGYFWELTAKIISRDIDIEASSIYSGKVKNVFIIDLPDFRPFSFVWRGFASVIASILMFVPFALLFLSSQYTQLFFLPNDNAEFYQKIYAISYNVIYFLLFALIPAMLWNYAKQNSIVAVWDIRKAIYLLETYPIKYIINTILFILFYLLNYYVIAGFALINGIQRLIFKVNYTNFFASVSNCIGVILFISVIYIIYLYSLHVYAYLLGTIASYKEG